KTHARWHEKTHTHGSKTPASATDHRGRCYQPNDRGPNGLNAVKTSIELSESDFRFDRHTTSRPRKLVGNLRNLELQLQCELDLPRRPEVSGREPRALDDPERSARRRQDWIAKVRMVEYVEKFRAELQVEPLGYFCVLGHRKIGVEKVRSDNRVSSERSRMTGAGNDRVGLKARRRRVAADRNIAERAGYRKSRIRRGGARRSRRRTSRGRPVERLTEDGIAEILARASRSCRAVQHV